MNYIRQLKRKRNTKNADLVGGDATGQRPKTRGRFLGDFLKKGIHLVRRLKIGVNGEL